MVIQKSRRVLIKSVRVVVLSAIVSFLIQGTSLANEKLQRIDRTLEVAFQHGRNYPPEFSSQAQRDSLEQELGEAITQLEQMLRESGQDQEVLFRLGKANTFAYNLDMVGSKENADKYFKQLFQLNPNHAEGHLYYGQHLSGRGEFDAAIEHLRIAADAGIDVALQMIGLAYLQKGQKDEAKKYFQEIHKKYPNNRQIEMLLDSLDPSSEYEYKLMKE